MIGGQRNVGPLALQDVRQPVREVDVSVAGALCLAERLEQGFIADAVELACDCFEINVGHLRLLCCRRAAFAVSAPSAPRDGIWRRAGMFRSKSSRAPSSWSSPVARTGRDGWVRRRPTEWRARCPNRAARH